MSEMRTCKKSNGSSVTTDKPVIPVSAWLMDAQVLFGPDPKKWRFRCPMCGKTWSIAEFTAAGGDVNGAYVECIGRHQGAGAPGSPDGNPNGCNWAAYGLFGIPNDKGTLVQADDGTVVEVFPFDTDIHEDPDGPAGILGNRPFI